jgi:5-methylcytosine-specific restriction enzyme A
MKPRVRATWDKWYGTARWLRRRARQLKSHPLCAMCEARGIITPATICDHVVPHHGDRNKFEFGKLQSLCVDCHDVDKRQVERLGFSRRIGADGWPTDPKHPCYR